MADDPKNVGKGDRIRASMQDHEVQYIAKSSAFQHAAHAGHSTRQSAERRMPPRPPVFCPSSLPSPALLLSARALR